MAGKGKFDLQLEVDQNLLDEIEEIGNKEERTRNGQVIKFLRDGVNLHKNKRSRATVTR